VRLHRLRRVVEATIRRTRLSLVAVGLAIAVVELGFLALPAVEILEPFAAEDDRLRTRP
jgi:hypothetical protein